jgi:ABC-type Co2+ transport system permease subunit
MTLVRILIPAFGLLAILGALMASGRLGESGWLTAVGITLIVTGVIGVLNVIFFRRLKAAVDRMAEEAREER